MKKPRSERKGTASAKATPSEGQDSGPQNRTETGRFPAGVSGNPGGRPKDDPELIEAFRARTMKAVATLDKAMDDFANNVCTAKGDPLVPAAAAVKAAEVTLNRGWGAAPQTIKLDAKVSADVQHDVRAVVQSPQRLANIARVLEESGALALAKLEAETAEPVETKEPT